MKYLLLQACIVVRTANLKISHRRLLDYIKTLHQKAFGTTAAQLFFIIQPIRSLIYGFVVDVAVVKSYSLLLGVRGYPLETLQTTILPNTTSLKRISGILTNPILSQNERMMGKGKAINIENKDPVLGPSGNKRTLSN